MFNFALFGWYQLEFKGERGIIKKQYINHTCKSKLVRTRFTFLIKTSQRCNDNLPIAELQTKLIFSSLRLNNTDLPQCCKGRQRNSKKDETVPNCCWETPSTEQIQFSVCHTRCNRLTNLRSRLHYNFFFFFFFNWWFTILYWMTSVDPTSTFYEYKTKKT